MTAPHVALPVKRWCGRAAAGTETAGMNPMVEWHGDPDEGTPYVLASDYDALAQRFTDTVPRWIPASERPPEVCVDVVVLTDDPDCPCWVGWLESDGNWASPYDSILRVTHWMPLPEAPK